MDPSYAIGSATGASTTPRRYLSSLLQLLSACTSFVDRVKALGTEEVVSLSASLHALIGPDRTDGADAYLDCLRRLQLPLNREYDVGEVAASLLLALDQRANDRNGCGADGDERQTEIVDAAERAGLARPALRTFGFDLRYTLICASCGEPSERSTRELMLGSQPPETDSSVQQAVTAFLTPELIERAEGEGERGWECSMCKHEHPSVAKVPTISGVSAYEEEPPDYLLIRLLRFKFDAYFNRERKIDSVVAVCGMLKAPPQERAGMRAALRRPSLPKGGHVRRRFGRVGRRAGRRSRPRTLRAARLRRPQRWCHGRPLRRHGAEGRPVVELRRRHRRANDARRDAGRPPRADRCVHPAV